MGSPEIEFLRGVSLFQDVEESVLRALWPSFRERRLRRGEVLFRTGEPGEELFLRGDAARGAPRCQVARCSQA